MDLVLLRHLKPIQVEGICYGKTDVSAPANLAGLSFAEDFPVTSMLWTSPLSRCLNLAQALHLKFGPSLVVDDRLAELDFGIWEMQTWDAIGPERLNAWITSGFSDLHQGESLLEFDRRIASWWTQLDQNMNHIVLTHAGVIRSIHRQFLGLTLEESLLLPVPFGSGIAVTLI